MLSIAFWIFIISFIIAVGIVAIFLVRDFTHIITVMFFTDDTNPICENCSCQDFDYVKEDDNYHHVPYGCEYNVKVCKNCGNRKC